MSSNLDDSVAEVGLEELRVKKKSRFLYLGASCLLRGPSCSQTGNAMEHPALEMLLYASQSRDELEPG